ncbi:hypothetical protein PIROE2DRAFT_13782 [Piromyces sp. E2]|nr:hypothetical protein PIROE2DRAFT_13782 [Piromyces sp. E2]|eukprot:OUM60434.1 hypothetical protein PIROE2DRAFT_13782 [Piromyces sp. E2]
MNFKSSIVILGLVSKIYAATFSVVSFDGACQLNAGGQLYEMTQSKQGIPLYTVEASVQTGSTYNYVCGGKEDVQRTLTDNSSHNELVGRSKTIIDMPEFGFPNAKPWNRSIGRTELFDPDYVPIIIISPDQKFFTGASRSTTFGSMTFILKDNVFTFNNVPASGKNYDEDKFQFRVTLPNGGIYNRDVLKFRPSSYDPVFFRQMLYGDIAHAIGNPAHESVAARVYLSDGTAIGLYVLQEDCTTESFIRTAFYGNPETQQVTNYQKSIIYDCGTGADFNPQDPFQLGSFMPDDTTDQKIELQEMINKVAELNIMDDNAVKNLDENWLELDTLYRALALEYLAGHWDSYWFMTTNFVVFHPAEETEGEKYSHTKYKYYFIDQDFDQTWGSNMKATLDAGNYPNKPYYEYVNQSSEFWKALNADEGELEPGTRILLNKFLGCDGQQSCSTKTYFENHLKDIVQHIFNPVAMKMKTDGYKERLSEEVQWDTTISRLHVNPNSIYHFTYDDFVNGIDGPTGMFPYGILDWTEKICNTVCNQFGITYDKTPYTPETAAQVKPQSIEAGTKYDDSANLQKSGSVMNKANTAMIVLAALISYVILL